MIPGDVVDRLKKWMKQCQEAGRTPCQPSWPTPQAAACLKRGPTSLRTRGSEWGWGKIYSHQQIAQELVVVREGLKKLFVLSKGQRAVWWPRPMSGFSRMDVVTCTVVHKPAGQRRRRNQLNSKFSFCVRFSNKSEGTTNI